MNGSPLAVCISDIHFTPNTLELASSALKMAMCKADELGVPLIISGDTLDSKAIIRAECANRLLDIFRANTSILDIYMLVGNHDLLNEKGPAHSLEFLKPFVDVVEQPHFDDATGIYFIPYTHYVTPLYQLLPTIKIHTNVVVTHQGVQTAYMGHYVQDHTSLRPEAFDGLRVISGHYHRRQDIKCGETGLFSYIGNPYTLTFGEATDPPKGFQILNTDGSLTFVPTNLRKHIVVERTLQDAYKPIPEYNAGDLLWLKVTGPQIALQALQKAKLGEALIGHSNYRFDLIPIDDPSPITIVESYTDYQVLDLLIDQTSESDTQKQDLKQLYKELLA